MIIDWKVSLKYFPLQYSGVKKSDIFINKSTFQKTSLIIVNQRREASFQTVSSLLGDYFSCNHNLALTQGANS